MGTSPVFTHVNLCLVRSVFCLCLFLCNPSSFLFFFSSSRDSCVRTTTAWDHVALRPQKRCCLLGTGTGGWGAGGRGRESEVSTVDTARKRPERPWTAARTMEVLRPCPLEIARRLMHCAVAVSTAVLGRVTKTISVALLLRNNPKRKKSNFRSPAPSPCSWSLLG